MGLMFIYFLGVVLSIILIGILAYHEKQNGENIDDLPVALCLAFLSWFTVIMFILAYRSTYSEIFRRWFKKD